MGQDAVIRDLLSETRFADNFSDQVLDSLCRAARILDVSAGDVIFAEGTVEDEVFVIVTGHVALEMHVPHRGSVRLLTVGAGELVGWSGLIGDGLMTASAVVTEDGRLIALSSKTVRELCDADSGLGYMLMTRTAQAIAHRLLATRLQLLDVFSETEPITRPGA